MATEQSTIDFLMDQIVGAGDIASRKMFGDYALYCEGRVVAFVCDDQLFVKPTTKGRALIENLEEKPPYPGAKLYFWISGDLWEDSTWLSNIIRETASELPLPKKKK